MSQSVNVFVGKGPSLQQCVAAVESWLGIRLPLRKESEWILYETPYMGIIITAVEDHGLDDDYDVALGVALMFGNYPVELSFTRYALMPAGSLDTCRQLALSTAQFLCRALQTETMVTEGVQRMVRVYRPTDFHGQGTEIAFDRGAQQELPADDRPFLDSGSSLCPSQ